MNRLELLIKACRLERWRWRYWRLSLLSVSEYDYADPIQVDYSAWLAEDFNIDEVINDLSNAPLPFDIKYSKEGTYYFDGEAKDWVLIKDAEPYTPLFHSREVIEVPANAMPLVTESMLTTPGKFLFNWISIWDPFKGKIPYQVSASGQSIGKIVYPKCIDDHADPEDTTSFRVHEWRTFSQSLGDLTSLCPIITTVSSQKSLRTHPDLFATRDRLLEERKHELNDPAVVTEIQNILIKMDMEYLSEDESAEFYFSGSSYRVKRKKLLMMHGIQSAFQTGGKFDLINKSLSEGWDLTKLPAMFNDSREGTYDRGADTALGGEKVTFMQRIHQNIKVVPGDCGTSLTYDTMLTDYTFKRYEGLNAVVKGKYVRLDSVLFEEMRGRVVHLRRPILCKSDDFCSVCATDAYAKNPRGVSADIVSVASAVVSAFMSSMHGIELAVAHFNFKIHLR